MPSERWLGAAVPVPVAERVRLDPQAVDRHREHLVVADQQAQLDQLGLVEVAAQLGPRLVGELAPLVELVGGPQQRALTLRPSGVRTIAAGSLDVGA